MDTIPEEKIAVQEDELQAIAAIFDDVVDLRKQDVWKVSRPPEVLVSCTPQSSDSIGAATEHYVSVKLRIKLTPAYPDDCPSISLEEPAGLSEKQVEELTDKLNALCKHLCGQEMMFELINCTQSYLYANNKPPPKSFYDQMITNRQREEEELARQTEQVLRQKEMQEDLEIEAELARQQNEIKEENRKRRQARKISEGEERQGTGSDVRFPSKSPGRHGDSNSSTDSQLHTNNRAAQVTAKAPAKCPANHCSVRDFSFTMSKTTYQVMRGQCSYHDPAGSNLFSAFEKTRGIPMSIRQWVFDFSKSKVSQDDNLAKCRKMLTGAEQDLAKLLKLQTDNLIHYLSMHISTDGAKISLMVLTDARVGVSLTDFVKLPYKVDSQAIVAISRQLVQSLVYLHSKQIVHKDVKPSLVYVDGEVVRLADYGLYRRLNEIYQLAVSGNMESTALIVKRGQKEDIFRLGMTILFMVTNKFNEDERLPTIPTDTNKELKDFLVKCFNADEKTRWSANQLSAHPFLQDRQLPTGKVDGATPEVEVKVKEEEEDDPDSHLEAIILRDTSGASRLASEFQILGVIGEGGFGQVLKARNKLDRCLYAIKKITLNPKSKMLNKRITREVKLLSRLNHENVVRYYNSWIETSEELAVTDIDSSTTTTTTSQSNNKKSSLFTHDSVEANAPQQVDESVSWGDVSSEHKSFAYSSSSSDDDSSEMGDLFGRSFMRGVDSESEGVIFEASYAPGYMEDDSDDSTATKVKRSPPKSSPPIHNQFMYIQMEYCEKNTLRQAIDMQLYENVDRVWRLFREIIEGLVHLHEQGMIHRDLKPVNIFLDVNDHVKIGDFGLATTAFIDKQLPEEGFGTGPEGASLDIGLSQSTSVGDGRHTGRVGTLLYVSPEIKMCHGKASYSQKVDMYSLGIIFFEMCYRPLTTMMERDRIIGNVRRPDVILPDDFDLEQNAKQISILRWVLDHDPSKRPSSLELLQSDFLPKMEDEEIHERFQSMLLNPQTKGYKRMLTTIFNQSVPRKFDFIYDHDIHKGVTQAQLRNRQTVRSRLEKVFTRHGALELDLPLMLPKLSVYENYPLNVTLMDHAGNLVSLPYDLRVPFARYSARNDIKDLKRYSISRVYRERKPHGIQPHEHLQCAFDIISPSKESIVPDAEVLAVTQQIINEFPYLESKDYCIHMNHTLLMKSILLYCGLPVDVHNSVWSALIESKGVDKSKSSVYTKLQSLSINEQTASQICTFLAVCESFSAISSYLKRITKSGQQAGSLAKTALHEMEGVITYARTLGVNMPVSVDLGLHYDIQNSSGIMYHIVSQKASGKSALDIIAAGYRYDKLVSKFKRTTQAGNEDEPAAVGVSLLYDKLVHAVGQEKEKTNLVTLVLYCVGKSTIQKEWLKLAQEFWSQGINTEIISDSTLEQEKVEVYCKDSAIKYLVTLTDYERGQVKLKVIDSEGVSERKFNSADIVEEVKRRVNPSSYNKSVSRYQQGDHNNLPTPVTPSQERGSDLHTFQSTLPISLITAHDTKQSLKARNKTETMIHNHLNNNVLSLLKKASEAEVVAFDLSVSEVKMLAAAYADSENEDQFDHNCNIAMEKQESAKNRKYMSKIVTRLHQIKFQANRPPVLIVFGLKDNSYRVIMG